MKSLLALLLFLPLRAPTCTDDSALKLDSIPSIQVAGTVIASGHPGISLDSLAGPFRALLAERGIKIDQNNYTNIVSTHVEITASNVGGSTVYAVSIASQYEEPCTTNRLGLQASCILWETHAPLHTFGDPEAVKPYVLNVVSSHAAEFLAQIAPGKPHQ